MERKAKLRGSVDASSSPYAKKPQIIAKASQTENKANGKKLERRDTSHSLLGQEKNSKHTKKPAKEEVTGPSSKSQLVKRQNKSNIYELVSGSRQQPSGRQRHGHEPAKMASPPRKPRACPTRTGKKPLLRHASSGSIQINAQPKSKFSRSISMEEPQPSSEHTIGLPEEEVIVIPTDIGSVLRKREQATCPESPILNENTLHRKLAQTYFKKIPEKQKTVFPPKTKLLLRKEEQPDNAMSSCPGKSIIKRNETHTPTEDKVHKEPSMANMSTTESFSMKKEQPVEVSRAEEPDRTSLRETKTYTEGFLPENETIHSLTANEAVLKTKLPPTPKICVGAPLYESPASSFHEEEMAFCKVTGKNNNGSDCAKQGFSTVCTIPIPSTRSAFQSADEDNIETEGSDSELDDDTSLDLESSSDEESEDMEQRDLTDSSRSGVHTNSSNKMSRVNSKLSICSITSLNEVKLKDIERAFAIFDKNSDGNITRDEVAEVFLEAEVQFTNEQLDEFMAKLDKDGNGTINYKEFCSTMSDVVMDAMEIEKRVRAAFQAIDVNGDGHISQSDLCSAMATLGENMSDRDAAELITVIVKDGNKHIDYEEFVFMMYSMNLEGRQKES